MNKAPRINTDEYRSYLRQMKFMGAPRIGVYRDGEYFRLRFPWGVIGSYETVENAADNAHRFSELFWGGKSK